MNIVHVKEVFGPGKFLRHSRNARERQRVNVVKFVGYVNCIKRFTWS